MYARLYPYSVLTFAHEIDFRGKCMKTDEMASLVIPSVEGTSSSGALRGRALPWPLVVVVLAAIGLAAVLALVGTTWLERPAVAAWRTVCLAIAVQALPFLLLGTALSGAINAFVPAALFSKMLPRRPALAVPVAGVAGAVLPGCECAGLDPES